MRFGKNLGYLAVPQWKQCYLDYQHLKIFIRLIKQIVEIINHCESYLSKNKMQSLVDESFSLITPSKQNSINENILELKNLGCQANSLFFDAHLKSMAINRLFLHMKLLQLRSEFKKSKLFHNLHLNEHETGLLLEIIEYIYVQTSYLQTAKQMNLQGERKIFKKHSKYAEQMFQTPRRRNKKVLRISKELAKLLNELQNFYVKHSQGSSKKNRDRLRQLSKKVETSRMQTFMFGTWIGICFSILGVLIAILSYTGKSVETDFVFNRDFPTWRGIALLIFYTWVLGLDVYAFQKYSISHRIIFQFNEHHYSTSTHVLLISGFFSTFFLIMFAIYTLAITDLIKIIFQPYFLVLFVWGFFILFFINPLPILSYKSRLYALKLGLKSVLAPFLGVSFPVIWMTDQLVSLITPLKDLAYTICYYERMILHSQANISYSECSSSTRVQVVFVVGAIAFSFRILQCLRQGYDKGKYLFQPQFYNTLKYAFSLITLILSFLWKAGNDKIIYAWIVFAVISTLYSYIWDLKMDWALFEKDSPHKFLRRFVCYPVNSYYVIIVLNFLFRMVWVLTLSPSIANRAFGSPQIFALVTGMIQIIRRGIWNLLRVQKEHIANCRNFKAIPSTIFSAQTMLISSLTLRKNQQTLGSTDLIGQSLNFQAQIQQLDNEIKNVRKNHLQILYQQLDLQTKQKSKRIQKTKELSKQIKKKVQLLNFLIQIPKKNNKVVPFDEDNDI